MINICVICGKEFEAIKSTKKYCSNACMNQARRERWKNKQHTTDSQMPEKVCLICGKIFRPKNGAANQRTCCYECMPDGVQLTRGGFLAKIKEIRGGTCVHCGYNKCLAALEFHHVDPTQKDFTISNDRFHLQDALKETQKCILLCSNCHKELHAGLWKYEKKEEVEP